MSSTAAGPPSSQDTRQAPQTSGASSRSRGRGGSRAGQRRQSQTQPSQDAQTGRDSKHQRQQGHGRGRDADGPKPRQQRGKQSGKRGKRQSKPSQQDVFFSSDIPGDQQAASLAKLVQESTASVVLHGIGDDLHQPINLALQVQSLLPSLQFDVETDTVTTVDDRQQHPPRGSKPPVRQASAVRIRFCVRS